MSISVAQNNLSSDVLIAVQLIQICFSRWSKSAETDAEWSLVHKSTNNC